MGLIKAIKNSVGSVISDQWKEYFYCDALSNDVLMVKGQKKINGGRNSNKGMENVISNGSVIAVNEGQCMIIVEQGEIVDVCAQPGEFVFDNSTEPSLFFGDLGESARRSFDSMVKRFSFGGNAAKDQRVYYFNTKEIMNNMYGTATPIPFHIVDHNTGFQFETTVKCNGMYTFRLSDPILFYKNVCANVTDSFQKSEILPMMKNELLLALQPSMAEIGGRGVLPSQLVAHTKDLTEVAKRELNAAWTEVRGIELVAMTIMPSFPSEDMERINKWADTAMMRVPGMAEARKTEAFSNMMENMNSGRGGDAAGSAMSMMAMNMMGNMLNNGNSQPMNQTGTENVHRNASVDNGWTCNCGQRGNTGRFCSECGAPKPSQAGWTCSCGAVNQGKFCQNCGAKKPQGAPLYRCDKCGWQPEDPANPPKFCPECGDAFDDNDRV